MSDVTMGGFFSGYLYDGRPYTGDVSKRFNPIGMPHWFARGSMNRAFFSREGPYDEPSGLYQLPANYGLVFWEVKQGTPDWTPPPDKIVPTIFSIHPINRTFVTPGSFVHKVVDPDHIYAPGDPVCVWFSSASEPFIAGAFRSLSDLSTGENRDNSGRLF